MSRIRVLLVHDYELARRGLRRMLEGYEDIEVVAEASDALEALSQVEMVSPDVILMDAEMPHVSGLETMSILKERGIPGAVIVLSLDGRKLADAVQLGARAYLVEEAEAEELASVIRQVPEGGFVFGASLMKSAQGQETALRYLAEQQSPPAQAGQEGAIETGTARKESVPSGEALEELEAERPSVKAGEMSPLNRRERRLLDLLAISASDSLIGHMLSTSEKRAERDVANMQAKLGLSSRNEVVAYAKRSVSEQGNGEEATARIAGAIPEERLAEFDAATREGSQAKESPGGVDGHVPEVPQSGEKAESLPSISMEANIPIGDLELVFSPPLEPLKLIRVTQWLKEVADAVIGETRGSWREDTVLKVTLRLPVSLSQMATDLPEVAEVTDEPFVGDAREAYEDVGRLGGRIGAGFSLSKRFRVTFKTD